MKIYVFFSFFTLHLACKFVVLSRIKLVILLVLGVGHLTDIVLPAEGIFESRSRLLLNLSSPDVEIFENIDVGLP